MEVVNTSTIGSQNTVTQSPTSQFRSRGNSFPQVPQEGTTISTLLSNTTTTDTKDFSQKNDPRQKRYKKNCYCNLEPTLREVKANTSNKGRLFWSCSKFGGPDHASRCKFFRWDDSQDEDENDFLNEQSSSTVQKRSEMPYVLIEMPPSSSSHPNPDTENNNENNHDHNNDEVNLLSSHLDQFLQTRETSTTTPPITLHRRIRNFRRRASLPQAPGSPPTRSPSPFPINTSNNTITTTFDATRNLSSDVYTRKLMAFGNWDDVPKYSTLQLLDIMQNHLVQQGKVKFILLYNLSC